MDWARIVGKITGTVDQHLLDRYEYVLAENRVWRSRANQKVRFTDPERIALAMAARPLGRAMLAEVAKIVTPDTLLRWHRRLVENKTPTPRDADSREPGRPPTDPIIVDLVLQFARENRSWGYYRIAGALKELGHELSDTTVGNILRDNGVDPAP